VISPHAKPGGRRRSDNFTVSNASATVWDAVDALGPRGTNAHTQNGLINLRLWQTGCREVAINPITGRPWNFI
jgi:hypothetical protein